MAQFTIYRSGDSGAPVLSGSAGALITVLDAVLVNGYTASVTSITRSGSTATVTTATNHGLNTGNSTTIAGANETDYNGTFVVTVTGVTTFTYTVPGTPATPATGTITWKKLAPGWTKPFIPTATKAIYRPPSGNRFYLRVLDDGSLNGASNAQEAAITGYENPTDIDATNPDANPFPTAAQSPLGTLPRLPVRKSNALSGAARDWVAVADARTLYFFAFTGDQAAYYAWMFGEIFSFKTGDLYNTVITARNAFATGAATSECLGALSNVTFSVAPAFFIARGHNDVLGPVNVGRHGDKCKNTSDPRTMQGTVPFTNPEDGKIYLSQIWVHDPATAPINSLRGRMRGFYQFMHPVASGANGDTFGGEASGEYVGKTFLLLKSATNGTGAGAIDGNYVIETSNTLETN